MKNDPYARFRVEDLILRDLLAADRTVLANERTLLSYVRTAMAFAGAGTALIHFFDSYAIEVLGWCMVPVAVVILLIGLRRYWTTRLRLSRLLDPPAPGDV